MHYRHAQLIGQLATMLSFSEKGLSVAEMTQCCRLVPGHKRTLRKVVPALVDLIDARLVDAHGVWPPNEDTRYSINTDGKRWIRQPARTLWGYRIP